MVQPGSARVQLISGAVPYVIICVSDATLLLLLSAAASAAFHEAPTPSRVYMQAFAVHMLCYVCLGLCAFTQHAVPVQRVLNGSLIKHVAGFAPFQPACAPFLPKRAVTMRKMLHARPPIITYMLRMHAHGCAHARACNHVLVGGMARQCLRKCRGNSVRHMNSAHASHFPVQVPLLQALATTRFTLGAFVSFHASAVPAHAFI